MTPGRNDFPSCPVVCVCRCVAWLKVLPLVSQHVMNSVDGKADNKIREYSCLVYFLTWKNNKKCRIKKKSLLECFKCLWHTVYSIFGFLIKTNGAVCGYWSGEQRWADAGTRQASALTLMPLNICNSVSASKVDSAPIKVSAVMPDVAGNRKCSKIQGADLIIVIKSFNPT